METLEKKASRGKRGQGCVYRKKGTRNYWIKFNSTGARFSRVRTRTRGATRSMF
jgi:hypothetical protein